MNKGPRTTVAWAVALSLSIAATLVTHARADSPLSPTDEGEPDDPDAGATSSSSAPTAPPPATSATRSDAKRERERERERERDGMLPHPGGAFTMGSADRAAPPNERPPHVVTLKPFWLDRTEVTVGAYRACVLQDGRCAPPPRTSAKCTYAMGDPELPVSCVRWADAESFCRAKKKRLPSEAEWEFAARGITTAVYPWGGTRSSCSVAVTLVRDTNSVSCSGARPSRVGTHAAGGSGFGVQDLSGNVEEWVADYYAEHLAHVAPRTGSSRVLRGGGWLSAPSASRTTTRNWGSVIEAGANVGFRCARDGD